MRSVRLAAAAFLFGGLFPLAAPLSSACAAEGPSAVLVVDTEQAGGLHRFCVSLPDASVSGIELVELASQQHGLQYRLGYGGNVVCQLAGVGYGSDECLREGPEFWGYWRGDGSGGWDWSSSGGHATRVENGDVEGWSWGTGNDGSSHPAPASTTFASVCGRPADPPGDSGGGRDEDDDGSGAGSGGDPNKGATGKDANASAAVPGLSDQIEAARKAEEAAGKGPPNKRATNRKGRPDEENAKPEPARSNQPVPEATATAAAAEPTSFSDDDPNGVPVGGVLAALAGAVCVGGAVFFQRRRSRTG
jgi:hypothetical protein